VRDRYVVLPFWVGFRSLTKAEEVGKGEGGEHGPAGEEWGRTGNGSRARGSDLIAPWFETLLRFLGIRTIFLLFLYFFSVCVLGYVTACPFMEERH
jgi:hypothetical protein